MEFRHLFTYQRHRIQTLKTISDILSATPATAPVDQFNKENCLYDLQTCSQNCSCFNPV